MTQKKHYRDLYVYINGVRVGTLAQTTTSGLVFTYNHDWLHTASFSTKYQRFNLLWYASSQKSLYDKKMNEQQF
jgi:hypothetical protein